MERSEGEGCRRRTRGLQQFVEVDVLHVIGDLEAFRLLVLLALLLLSTSKPPSAITLRRAVSPRLRFAKDVFDNSDTRLVSEIQNPNNEDPGTRD